MYFYGMNIKKGTQLIVTISDISTEGKGIHKTEEGFVIFVDKLIPGDKALVEITKKKSSYAEAKLLELNEKSATRIEPPCEHFGTCGGCKFQYLPYQNQLDYKHKVVVDAFERIGGFTIPEIPAVIGSDDFYNYRNKMEFSFSDDKWYDVRPEIKPVPDFALGLHVPRFYTKVLDVEKCFLQSPLSNDILNLTREYFKAKGISIYSTKTHSGFLRFLIIRQSKNTDDIMINLVTYDYDEQLIRDYTNLIRTNIPEVTTFINSFSTRKAQVAVGEDSEIIFGNGFIIEKLNNQIRDLSFKISPNSFFQTNTLQAGKLYSIGMEFLEPNKNDIVFDLYCGTGSISLFIADKVKKVTGVELVEDAIDNAKENAKLNNIENVEFVLSDIKDYIKKESSLGDINLAATKIILDPPRSGLHPDICKILSETSFEKIVYISCNPVTQARDIAAICSAGNYSIEKIQPVDMFPQTHHVENVCLLIKN